MVAGRARRLSGLALLQLHIRKEDGLSQAKALLRCKHNFLNSQRKATQSRSTRTRADSRTSLQRRAASPRVGGDQAGGDFEPSIGAPLRPRNTLVSPAPVCGRLSLHAARVTRTFSLLAGGFPTRRRPQGFEHLADFKSAKQQDGKPALWGDWRADWRRGQWRTGGGPVRTPRSGGRERGGGWARFGGFGFGRRVFGIDSARGRRQLFLVSAFLSLLRFNQCCGSPAHAGAQSTLPAS